MSNRAARLIATGVVAAGGGLTLAVGSLARSPQYNYGDAPQMAGLLMLVVAATLCLIDWIDSWREDRRNKSAAP